MLRSFISGFFLFVALAVSGTAAWATAVYSTIAGSVFAFTVPVLSGSPSPTVTVLTNSDSGAILTDGNGTAMHSGTPSGPDARPVSTTVSASGSAFAPPYSFAQSSRMSGHLIKIDNSSGLEAVSVLFRFDMSWTLLALIDDAATETASAGAFFSIAGIDSEILTIGGLGIVSVYENQIGISSPGGPGGILDSTFILGDILVAPGSINEFSVITDVAGRANANDVPEPATLTLIGLGVLIAMRARRRCH